MGLYGKRTNSIFESGDSEREELYSVDEMTSLLIGDELRAVLGEAELQEFLDSDECEKLMEAGLLHKKTIIRLNKVDDLSRRTKIAALQLAKEHNDPIFEKLALNRVKEKQYISAIVKKYGVKGQRAAKQAQKDFMKVPTLQKKLNNAFNDKDDE